MNAWLFTGKQVRFAALDPEKDWGLFLQWSLDSEYGRLLDHPPVRFLPRGTAPDWVTNHTGFLFMIRTLNENKPIGFAELDGLAWAHGEAWVGIGIGERDFRDKGYGTDALRLLERYAFTELDLHRLTLSVFEYNTRAMHVYEKTGFRVEGRKRQSMQRDGRRWDMLIMGILKAEWEKLNESQA